MKHITTLLLLLSISLFAWADDINLLVNDSFEDAIENTWRIESNSGAVASYTIIEETPSWVTSPIHRMQIELTETTTDKDIYSVYLANSGVIPLNIGDTVDFGYYCRATLAGSILQPILFRTDAPEGEDSILTFPSLTLATAFGGQKFASAIAKDKGNYELRMCIGGTVADYVFDNFTLTSSDYQADGAPVITSFSIQMEQQGDQGVNQIIGRATATDLENDDFTLDFSILSGGGSITTIDSATFMYEEEGPGEKLFKVIATDVNGNVSTKTATYTVSDFDTSQLYFDEDVWALVRAVNGYTSHASFTFPTNDPSLPNVLLMGNSISIGYTPYVRTALEGKANIYRIPDNGGSTLDMLDNYLLWLGDTHWDVIHFNWGLHDLKYLLNNSLNINGTQVVPVAEYGVNMESIVNLLSTEADHLIFATTSHIPSAAAGRISGDEVVYNTEALAVMANHPEIMIDDQYTLTNEHSDEHNNEGDVHFNNAGKSRQANQVAEKILEILETTALNPALDNESTSPYYYNSNTTTLTQRTDVEIEEMSIYNISGQKLYGATYPSGQISISNYPSGLLIVTSKSKGEIFTQKIVH